MEKDGAQHSTANGATDKRDRVPVRRSDTASWLTDLTPITYIHLPSLYIAAVRFCLRIGYTPLLPMPTTRLHSRIDDVCPA